MKPEKSQQNAPVVLFVYNRPGHTLRTLQALLRNPECSDTDLVVFADGPKTAEDEIPVRTVRAHCAETTGFRTVSLIKRKENIGLAENIIGGLTSVFETQSRAIVLEDDIVVSASFLSYMNTALTRYADEEQVWHISGWTYPIDATGLHPSFFWRGMNCWGWATWANRWSAFSKAPDHLIGSWSKERISRFNIDNTYPFWAQVEGNAAGRLNTWAIFWYATIFEMGGLCLNPSISLVENIGLDDTGVHSSVSDYPGAIGASDKCISDWPPMIAEDAVAVDRIKSYLNLSRGPMHRRVARGLRRLLSRTRASR